MSSLKTLMLACALPVSSVAAHATSVSLAADGHWRAFTVDSFVSTTGDADWIDADDALASGYGSGLSFDFVVGSGQIGTLTVVDAGLSGDVFRVFNQSVLLGTTSSVPVTSYEDAAPVVLDFDAALAAPAFSRSAFTLAAGSYSIRGELLQSVMLDGIPLNATVGAIKLTVSPVPEPRGGALVLAVLGAAALIHRRRGLR